MNVRVSNEADTTRVGLEGRFGFEDRHAFTGALESALAEPTANLLFDLR